MEDNQQLCLKWNNHQSTLIQNFDTLLESGTLVDCTLAAEGKALKVHKVILSACSPYFECLLSEHYDKHPVFILKDVKFKELKAMIDFMYRGEVNISQGELVALVKVAESLQIKGLSESIPTGSSKTESRLQKTVSQSTAPSLDIPHASFGLTIEKNNIPRQTLVQSSMGDLPEDSASPQVSKGLSSREDSQSPTSRKRKRFRRRNLTEDSMIENQDASNSNDMPQQMGVPALGITPVAEENVHTDSTDSLGRSALMTQLTKPAEMLQLQLVNPEPNNNLIETKSEHLEEDVEDLTLDEDMNDLNDMEQDNNRAGPSHDPALHPAELVYVMLPMPEVMLSCHVTSDRSNAQLTKPADEMLQLPLVNLEPNDNLIETKSEHLEEGVEDLTLDEDMNDLNDMEQDNNRAGPSHDPALHPAGGVVDSVTGAPGATDKVFLGAQEANDNESSWTNAELEKFRKGDKFICDKCGYSFKKKRQLRYHKRHIKCNKVIQCSICKKKYSGNQIGNHKRSCLKRYLLGKK